MMSEYLYMYKCLFPIHIMIQVARLIVVTNLATSWRQLHWQQIWSPGGATWLPFLAKLLRIALLASSVELISSSTSFQFHTHIEPECMMNITKINMSQKVNWSTWGLKRLRPKQAYRGPSPLLLYLDAFLKQTWSKLAFTSSQEDGHEVQMFRINFEQSDHSSHGHESESQNGAWPTHLS